MSLSILISFSDSPSMILGGSHAMVPLVAEVAEYMKNNRPDIYAAAFEQLEWGGNVDLGDLNKEDFAAVYAATLRSYETFLSSMPREEIQEKEPGVLKKWQEYIKALEADPRFTKE